MPVEKVGELIILGSKIKSDKASLAPVKTACVSEGELSCSLSPTDVTKNSTTPGLFFLQSTILSTSYSKTGTVPG